MKFQADLFDREVKFRLGEDIGKAAKGLRLAKETVELEHWRLVEALANKSMPPAEFIKLFNKMTLKFQDDVASSLKKTQYRKLMALDRDEQVILASSRHYQNLVWRENCNSGLWQDLISVHPQTPDETLLVSNSETRDFPSWQGNRGVARGRTLVRRTSKPED